MAEPLNVPGGNAPVDPSGPQGPLAGAAVPPGTAATPSVPKAPTPRTSGTTAHTPSTARVPSSSDEETIALHKDEATLFTQKSALSNPAPNPKATSAEAGANVAGKPAVATAASHPVASATVKPPAGKKAAAPVRAVQSYRDRLHSVTFTEWAHRRLREAPGYVISVVLHISVLFLLSLMVLPAKDREDLFNTIIAKTETPPDINEKIDDTQIIPDKLEKLEASAATMQVDSQIVADKPSPLELDVSDAAPQIEAPDPTEGGAGPQMPKGDLAGRSQKARGAMLASQGGTAASEVAVNSGLKWLARHQRPDGSWSFQHGPDEPGTLDNPTGATGLALLAFLGGGHTHKAGDYQRQVGSALTYLIGQMKVTGAGGDLRVAGDGQGMYTQGICAIALCEAYALSKDKALKQPTQLAINFIVNAQDPQGGGWRYQPGQKGDTSVVGWQVMALKSAKIAKLNIPNKTIGKATYFLNSVQTEGGAKYGYDSPGGPPGTTSVGLLCRMYLGWTPKNAGLVKGVEFLGSVGPQPGNIYFDYYATQVLHHWGGEPWTKWNNVMREYLVTTQEKAGGAAGSWKPTGGGHDEVAGGRLYRTCMSVMTLEVYYRHLPIYQRETIKVDF